MRSAALRQYQVLVGLGLFSPCLGQEPFSLDTTFRTVVVDQNVNSIALMENGDLLLTGSIRFPGDLDARLIAKINSTGGQVVGFPYGFGGGKITPWADKYYISNSTIARLDAQGMNDPSFVMMNDGLYISPVQPGDYLVFPDGRILLSGRHTLNDTARNFVGNYNLIWLTNTGYLDTTRTHRSGPGTVIWFKQMFDGGFICTGSTDTFEGVAVDRIFKVDSLGVPDTTFDTGVYSGAALGYLPLPDGRVYAGGVFQSTQTGTEFQRLVRFLPDGTIDPTFVQPVLEPGVLTGSLGAIVSKLVPWSNGRFIVLGKFQYVNGQPRNGVCMLEADGALVDLFNGQGVGTFPDESSIYGSVTDILVDSLNGYAYIAGRYHGYTDGMINDTTQRFVSRLFLGDVSMTVPQVRSSQSYVIQLSPNPTCCITTLHLNHVPVNAQLRLCDALGREVLRQFVLDQETSLNIQHLPDGIYSIHLFTGAELVGVQRLVVQH